MSVNASYTATLCQGGSNAGVPGPSHNRGRSFIDKSQLYWPQDAV